jgi:hypothetical protein
MNLLNSAPLGFDQVGWGGLLRASLLVWLAPAALALVALALQMLAGTRDLGGDWTLIWAYSMLLLATPLLSWFMLVLAAPFVQVLMNRGWFGWIPALVTGMAAGSLVGFMLGSDLPLSLGALMVLALRGLLGRWYGAAFETGPDAL